MKRTSFRSIALLLAVLLLFASAPQLFAANETQIRNVIFMIGDGMGENHLELAKQEGYTLFMDAEADQRGQSKTRSTERVTDSAAGATALSAGVRTNNGCIGTYAFEPEGKLLRPRYISEQALSKGMRVGIVTTDKTTGATPAGFTAHVESRKMTQKIHEQQLASRFDLIWGAAADEADRAAAEARGFRYVTTKAEMQTLKPGSRSFGQFSGNTWRTVLPQGDRSPTLAEMTEKAIDLLSAEQNRGFFLMVEGAHIDKHSHQTEDGADYRKKHVQVAEAVKGFDNAIQAAVAFARKDGHTLVVVTADHETGALTEENGVLTFHSGSHSAANVPVFVYCCKDLIPDGAVVNNKELPRRVAAKLGWKEWEFPRADAGPVLTQWKQWFYVELSQQTLC